MYIHMYIHSYTHIYICTHTHTHTHWGQYLGAWLHKSFADALGDQANPLLPPGNRPPSRRYMYRENTFYKGTTLSIGDQPPSGTYVSIYMYVCIYIHTHVCIGYMHSIHTRTPAHTHTTNKHNI